ncbi:MAG: NTP transferase domain-containing protein, partial [Chloroflexi bacterium]|nr:NTP transferase domain-containing protein [Chloroflexota bacterium]
ADRLEPWARRFPRARAVRNSDWETGKATSVVAGVRALPTSVQAVFVVAVDQPRPREVLRALLRRHQESGALVTVPVYRGRRGHPVMFSAALLGELEQVRDESLGIRAVVERHRDETVELLWDDDIVLLDLNTPEVYQEAWRRLSRRP